MAEFIDPKTIKIIIESRLDHLPLLAKAAKGVCSTIIDDEWLLYQLELCVVEAVSNIIIHAYQRKAGNSIEVDVKLDKQHVIFKFLDTGLKNTQPFGSELTFDPTDIANLPESGRGIPLIYQFMDDVVVEQEQGKNITILSKKLS